MFKIQQGIWHHEHLIRTGSAHRVEACANTSSRRSTGMEKREEGEERNSTRSPPLAGEQERQIEQANQKV